MENYLRTIEARLSLNETTLLLIKAAMNRKPVISNDQVWHMIRLYLNRYDDALLELNRGIERLKPTDNIDTNN